jgi:hypothetical protein
VSSGISHPNSSYKAIASSTMSTLGSQIFDKAGTLGHLDFIDAEMLDDLAQLIEPMWPIKSRDMVPTPRFPIGLCACAVQFVRAVR